MWVERPEGVEVPEEPLPRRAGRKVIVGVVSLTVAALILYVFTQKPVVEPPGPSPTVVVPQEEYREAWRCREVWRGAIVAPGEVSPRSSLPIWAVGDNWTYVNITENVTFALAVVDVDYLFRDTPCYRLEGEIRPPLDNWAVGIRWMYEKSTLALVGETIYAPLERAENSLITSFTRTLADNLWPLENAMVENLEIREDVEIEWSGVRAGEPWPGLPDPTSRTYQVSVEDFVKVAVRAGTFECFKILWRTLEGEPVETRWYSDEVKNFVKIVDHTTGETLELSDYGLTT
jgi:hypothetical protein